jgi:sporulation protein YqfC
VDGVKKIAQTAKRIAAGLNLPLDTLTGQFRLVMYGDNRAIVENHGGILDYSGDSIRLRVQEGELVFSGTALALREMDGGTVVIGGRIHRMELLGGGGVHE